VALTEAVMSVTEAQITEYVHEGIVPVRNGNRLSRAAPTGIYPTEGGQWVAIGANGDSIFRRLSQAIGRPEWLDDEELTTNRGRVRRVDDLDNGISDWTSRRTMAEVVDQLNEAGVPCGPVYTVKEIAEDPHFRARQALVEAPSTERNEPVTMPGVMPALERHPGNVRAAGGPIGRDTENVLSELLGLSDEDILELENSRVVVDHRVAPEVPSTRP
jgi:formyl-CoA transferase